MKARSVCVKLVVAAFLALMAPGLWAQDGLEGALSRANLASPVRLGMPFSQTLAAADFDGDNKPDGAVLVDYGRRRSQSSFWTIELHFTDRRNVDLTFKSNATTLSISAVDVNRDGATDIVVEQPFTHKRLHVWLNDGRGGFLKVRSEDFPSAAGGNDEQMRSPSQRRDCPALWLPPQRSSEIAILTACGFPNPSSSAGGQSLPMASVVEPPAAALYSPRAPPLPLPHPL